MVNQWLATIADHHLIVLALKVFRRGLSWWLRIGADRFRSNNLQIPKTQTGIRITVRSWPPQRTQKAKRILTLERLSTEMPNQDRTHMRPAFCLALRVINLCEHHCINELIELTPAWRIGELNKKQGAHFFGCSKKANGL